jgi:hypothetical protein
MVEREVILVFAFAVMIVGAVTVLMHERHYQSRREQILEGRIEVIEKIIGESRG